MTSRGEGQEEQQKLAGAMFAMVDKWVSLVDQPTPEVEPGSALAGDARKSPSLQVAHSAWNGISHSVDHLHALRALLVDAHLLNLYAPFTLVRSALENAATAVWLLEPSQRSERLRRRLKLAHYEAWEEGKVHELLPAEALQGKRTAQERMVEIRTLAAQLGLNPHDIAGQFSYEKVIRNVAKTTFHDGDNQPSGAVPADSQAALVWRLTSGFTHGRYWASFSCLECHVVLYQGNVANVRLTGDVDRLLTLVPFPFVLTDRALRLYEQRRRSPYTAASGAGS